MIKEIKGNLITLAKEGKYDIIAHGTNCFCTMNIGIAKQIKDNFLEVYKTDLSTKRGDIYKLGEYSCYYYKNLRLKVVNLYIQYHPNTNAEYTALALAIRNMRETLKGDEIIGLPQIGCGIGGLRWELVKDIIITELGDFHVDIISLPKFSLF